MKAILSVIKRAVISSVSQKSGSSSWVAMRRAKLYSLQGSVTWVRWHRTLGHYFEDRAVTRAYLWLVRGLFINPRIKSSKGM